MQGRRWRGGRQRLIVVVTVVCSPLIVPLLFFLFFPILCFFCLFYFCFRPSLTFRRRQEAQEAEGEAKVAMAKPVPVAEGRLLQKYLEDQLCLVGELGFLFEFGDDEEGSNVGDADDHPQKQYEQVGNGDFT